MARLLLMADKSLLIFDESLTGVDEGLQVLGLRGPVRALDLDVDLRTEAAGLECPIGALDLDAGLPTEAIGLKICLLCVDVGLKASLGGAFGLDDVLGLDGGMGNFTLPLPIECLDFKLSSANPLMLLGGSFFMLFSLSSSTISSKASFSISSRLCCRDIDSFFSSCIFFIAFFSSSASFSSPAVSFTRRSCCRSISSFFLPHIFFSNTAFCFV
mmetsp:Transcript_40350/g.87124  ORF Transcript_40350/g.87124 Transcript_40350/m.87124 type:complete len:214 (-) Transcript_40350:1518-2159(-)